MRDLLRGADAVDLDLAVEGDAGSVARALAERLGGTAREHERFGTATVRAGDLAFDLATTRTETYDEPGALPRVAEATLAEDLKRRDFTVNALAVALAGDDLGHLYDPHGGPADLQAGVVRILHAGSFLDDPTRLLRAVRYETRLGFQMDEDTERAARAALAEDALSTVSGKRVRDELMDLLAEHEAPAAVERMRELGLDRALHPALDPDSELVASASLGAAAIGADRGLVVACGAVRLGAGGARPLAGRAPAGGRRPRRGRARGRARGGRRWRRSCTPASACPRSCSTCSAGAAGGAGAGAGVRRARRSRSCAG